MLAGLHALLLLSYCMWQESFLVLQHSYHCLQAWSILDMTCAISTCEIYPGFLHTAPTANWWQLWWRMVNEATKNLGLTLLWFVRGCGMVWSDGQLSYCLGYLWWKRKPLAGCSSMQAVAYSSWCTGSSHSGCQQSVCWPSVHTNQSIALEEIVTCDYTWLSDD